ncbi:hypothetical protein K469DRAFT_713128, partial [Zopfia rhizophila CBS 207.26]
MAPGYGHRSPQDRLHFRKLITIGTTRYSYRKPLDPCYHFIFVHCAQVICILLAKDGTWASTQINLLNACLKAGVSRFAPAEFGPGPLAAPKISMLSDQVAVIEACRTAKSSHPGFEYAGFHLGLFMNYLGYGAEKEEEALAGKRDDGEFVWHVKDMRAEIPLTKEGKVPSITLTEIGDAGRFVAAACMLEKGKWEEDCSMVGETVRMDEVV